MHLTFLTSICFDNLNASYKCAAEQCERSNFNRKIIHTHDSHIYQAFLCTSRLSIEVSGCYLRVTSTKQTFVLSHADGSASKLQRSREQHDVRCQYYSANRTQNKCCNEWIELELYVLDVECVIFPDTTTNHEVTLRAESCISHGWSIWKR